MVTPSINNISQAVNIPASNNYEQYLEAYCGREYKRMKNAKWSWGVFFFGIFWELFYKMYKSAFLWIGIYIAIPVVVYLLSLLALIIGSGSLLLLALIIPKISTILLFVLRIIHAYSFYQKYFEIAHKKINHIIVQNISEEEKIKECKKAGKPNYWLPLTLLIVFVLVLIKIM